MPALSSTVFTRFVQLWCPGARHQGRAAQTLLRGRPGLQGVAAIGGALMHSGDARQIHLKSCWFARITLLCRAFWAFNISGDGVFLE